MQSYYRHLDIATDQCIHRVMVMMMTLEMVDPILDLHYVVEGLKSTFHPRTENCHSRFTAIEETIVEEATANFGLGVEAEIGHCRYVTSPKDRSKVQEEGIDPFNDLNLVMDSRRGNLRARRA